MPSNDHDRASSKFTNVSDNFNSNALAPYARGALEAPSGGTINAQTHMNPVHRLDILLRFPGLKVAIAAIKVGRLMLMHCYGQILTFVFIDSFCSAAIPYYTLNDDQAQYHHYSRSWRPALSRCPLQLGVAAAAYCTLDHIT